MNYVIIVIVNIIEAFAAYFLYHGLIQKKVSFRLQPILILALSGILLGIGFIYVDEGLMRMVYYSVCFIAVY